MNHPALFSEFSKQFKTKAYNTPRGIGVEAELPIVTLQGEAAGMEIIQQMFEYLATKGFEVKRDSYSSYLTSASRINIESTQNFDYHFDTITTDAGYSILEIVLAPQQNLHSIQQHFSEIINLLHSYFTSKNCTILGFGIQPVSTPSGKLLMPQERYLFFERFSQNNIIPTSEGSDAHLLTITASNQCHIDISREEAICGVNVLNALSGLQIALHANSSVWQGTTDTTYKATREFFWERCYPHRTNQMGIPPRFETMEEYLNYLLKFKPMLIKRKGQLLQILNKQTFGDFMYDKNPAIAQTLEGQETTVYPEIADIHYLNTFCYFDARLVPQYGTIESRMCCQQPPNQTLAPTALTLGILENLEASQELMNSLPQKTWQEIRQQAGQHTFATTINKQSIVPLLARLLDIATQGLKKRNLGEETFLRPLYQRLKQQKSPADIAINIFEKEGVHAFLEHYSFKELPVLHDEIIA